MPYVGRDPRRGNYLKLDDIQSSFNGSDKTFNLTSGGTAYYPDSTLSVLVSVGGTVLEPATDYGITNNQITFTNAPLAAYNFFAIVQSTAVNIGVPGDGVVTAAKLAKPLWYDEYFKLDSANNRVGIGVEDPDSLLHLRSASSPTIHLEDTSQTTKLKIYAQDSSSVVGTYTNHPLILTTNSAGERLKISGDGSQCTITSNAHDGGLEVLAGNNSQETRIRLQGKATNGTAHEWYMGASRSADRFYISNGSTSHFAILDDGKIGINSTTPSGAQLVIHNSDDSNLNAVSIYNDNGNMSSSLSQDSTGAGSYLQKDNAGNIKTFIRSYNTSYLLGGNIGIGTDNPNKLLDLHTTNTNTYSSAADQTPNQNTFLTLTNKAGTDGTGSGYYAAIRFAIANGATSNGWLAFHRTGDNQGDFTFKARNAASGANSYPELMRIKSTGDVGIGLNAPTARLHVNGTSNGLQARFGGTGTGLGIECGAKTNDNALVKLIAQDATYGTLTFETAGSERLRIDSGGRLITGGVVVPYPTRTATFQPVSGQTNTYVSIIGGSTSSVSGITFGDAAGSDVGNYAGMLEYYHSDDRLTYAQNASAKVTIDSAGKVGIGVTNPSTSLQVANGHINLSSGYSIQWSDSHERIEQSDGKIEFFTGNGQKMTLSSDNLGIGTATPGTNLHVRGTGTDILKIESTDAGAQGANLILQHSPGATNMADDDVISLLQFNGVDDSNNATTYSSIRAVATDVSNNSEKGDLTFWTRNGSDFLEKLRIDSDGRVIIGDVDNANAHANADDLIIGNTGNDERSGLTIVSDTDKDGAIHFSDGVDAGQLRGQIVYGHTWGSYSDVMVLYTAGTKSLHIQDDGDVILGEIGGTTYLEASTEAQLRVVGDASNSRPGAISLFGFGNTTDTAHARINFQQQTSGTGGQTTARIEAKSVGSSEDASDLLFYTEASGGSLTERLRITSDGVLYLGQHKTSTPADNVPYEIRVAPYGWGQSQDIAAISMGNHSGATGNDDGEIVFKTALNAHTDANGLTEKVRITSVGKVGIGTNNPTGKLHVADTNTTVWPFTATQSGTYAYTPYPHELVIDNDVRGTEGSFAGIYFNAGADTDGSKVATARIAAIDAGSYKADLVFSNRGFGGSDHKENLRITSAGKVGIGTNDPEANAKLDIWGDGSAYPTLRLGTEVYETEGEAIRFGRTDHGATDIRYHSITSYHHATGSSNYLKFKVHDGGSSPFQSQATALTLLGTGTVHIGPSTPTTSDAGADDLVIGNTTDGLNNGMTIWSHTSQNGNIGFADNDSNFRGAVQYLHGDDQMRFLATGEEKFRVTEHGTYVTPITGGDSVNTKAGARFYTISGATPLDGTNTNETETPLMRCGHSFNGTMRLWMAFNGSEFQNGCRQMTVDCQGTYGYVNLQEESAHNQNALGAGLNSLVFEYQNTGSPNYYFKVKGTWASGQNTPYILWTWTGHNSEYPYAL